jgi:hypothetical protein
MRKKVTMCKIPLSFQNPGKGYSRRPVIRVVNQKSGSTKAETALFFALPLLLLAGVAAGAALTFTNGTLGFSECRLN